MVFKAVVHNGVVELPPTVSLPDGTEVRIEAYVSKRFSGLLELAGTWAGDDADRVIEEVYATRSSASSRASFDS